MTQTDRVLAYLWEHPEGLTALEALDVIGTSRLAARVYDLRAAGNAIDESRERTRGGALISRYRLREPEGQLSFFASQRGARPQALPAEPAVPLSGARRGVTVATRGG